MLRECTILTLIIIVSIFLIKNVRANKGATEEKIIHKCCPFGKYVVGKKNCVNYSKNLTFSNTEIYDNDLIKMRKSLEEVFTIKPGRLNDSVFKSLAIDTAVLGVGIYLTENGTLLLEIPNAYSRWMEPIHSANFCVDYRIMKNTNIPNLRYWAIQPDDDYSVYNTKFSLLTASLISCFFMLLILIIYFVLPELQNLFGKILMAYVTSLFLAFMMLDILEILQSLTPVEACIGLSFGNYFFFLASFCWMNVMSYDIWRTFRSYEIRIQRRGDRYKFLVYCLYAWGLPFTMTIVLGVLNTVNLKHLPWLVTPNIPKLGCTLDSGTKLLYLYTPMTIIIATNAMFYLMTAYHVWRLSRGAAVLDSAASGNSQAHLTSWKRFMVHLKLFIVMGFTWIFEIVSYVNPDIEIWYITNTFNFLSGLIVFLIFVCKKKIIRKLCNRFGVSSTKSSELSPNEIELSSQPRQGDSRPQTSPSAVTFETTRPRRQSASQPLVLL